MSIERGKFFENGLAKETKMVSSAIVEVLALDVAPAAEVPKTRILVNKMMDLLENDKVATIQDKASKEYLPWAIFGRMVMHAGDCLNEGRENARAVRMYRWVAEKLGLGDDPRQIVETIDEKVDLLLDKLEANDDVDTRKLIDEVRTVNEALFPTGW